MELDGYVYRISTEVQQNNITLLTDLLSVKSEKCCNLPCVESGLFTTFSLCYYCSFVFVVITAVSVVAVTAFVIYFVVHIPKFYVFPVLVHNYYSSVNTVTSVLAGKPRSRVLWPAVARDLCPANNLDLRWGSAAIVFTVYPGQFSGGKDVGIGNYYARPLGVKVTNNGRYPNDY